MDSAVSNPNFGELVERFFFSRFLLDEADEMQIRWHFRLEFPAGLMFSRFLVLKIPAFCLIWPSLDTRDFIVPYFSGFRDPVFIALYVSALICVLVDLVSSSI